MPEVLSVRRREALRLDLEDQQKALIEEVCCLSRGLIAGSSVPRRFRSEQLSGEVPELPEGSKAAERLEAKARRLREISQTLARIDHVDFGSCECCGDLIPFGDLAADATRRCCDGRCGQLPGQVPT
ncbi:MAG: hypothetical protein EA417_05920 [Gammaproteobacteria bacterium]|nr:MAG: hypothetical protein EA417_05920 [Gammaproteobacteria bacterium]